MRIVNGHGDVGFALYNVDGVLTIEEDEEYEEIWNSIDGLKGRLSDEMLARIQLYSKLIDEVKGCEFDEILFQ